MRRIDFVYFDLGNVLASFDVHRACRNVARRWNVEPQRVHSGLWVSGLQDRFEHGELSSESFAEQARDVLGLSAETAPTQDLLRELSDMFEPIDEMAALVDAVRGVGIKLGILSNTCPAHWQFLLDEGYPSLRGPFDQLILSYEHGSMKPDRRLYEIARDSAGVDPGSILFLDDRLENVAAAKSCGWQAHQFTSPHVAVKLLRCLGVIG